MRDTALQLHRLLCRAQSGSDNAHVLALLGVGKDCGDLCQRLPRMVEADATQVVEDRGPNRRRQRLWLCETAGKVVGMHSPAMIFQKVAGGHAVLSTPQMSLTDVISYFTLHRSES